MRRSLAVAVIAAVLAVFSCGREFDDPELVARVGPRPIPVEEFRTRFSFTPHLERYRSLEYGKRWVLASLIGERLLALEAERRGISNLPEIDRFARQIEDEAIVEALFEQEIGSKIEVGDDELRQAYIRSRQELEVEILTFADAEEAEKAYRKIKSGARFKEVARESIGLGRDRVDLVLRQTIRWGQADPRLEEVAFDLEPGEVSQPVRLYGATVLLHLVDRKAASASESDFEAIPASLEKTVRQRKKEAQFSSLVRQVMGSTRLQVSGRIFAAVVEGFERAAGLDRHWGKTGKAPRQFLSRDDFEKTNLRLSNLLDEPLARFTDGEQWTVRQFLEKLRFGPYPLNLRSREDFIASLRQVVRRIAETERLAREGRRRGLQRSPYVRRQVAMWRDSMLAQALRQAIVDSVTVTPEEVETYFQEHQRTYASPGTGRTGSTLPQLSDVYGRVQKDALQAKREKALEGYLLEAMSRYDIRVNHNALDSAKVTDANMWVLKTHFPGRTIAPEVYPLARLPRWLDALAPVLKAGD